MADPWGKSPSGLLQNRLQPGMRSWDGLLPAFVSTGKAGIFPLSAILQQEVGPEITLALMEPTPFASEIRGLKPLEFRVNGALLDTPYGALICLVWWFLPLVRERPFALYENTLNPYDQAMMAPYQLLAAQSHWHLLLFGADRRVAGLWEFPNNFGIDAALGNFINAASQLSPGNFASAKQHFYNNWDLLELFRTLVEDAC